MKTILPGLLLLACAMPNAHASDPNNAFAIRGVGALPCEVYLKELEKKSSAAFMIGGWLDGYVTAVNRYAADTYDALSFESTELVANLLAGHCKSNPRDPIFGVLAALLTKLHDDRLQTREALIAFQNSNNLKPTGLPDQATLWRLLRQTGGNAALR
jgi:hypothetical protein